MCFSSLLHLLHHNLIFIDVLWCLGFPINIGDVTIKIRMVLLQGLGNLDQTTQKHDLTPSQALSILKFNV